MPQSPHRQVPPASSGGQAALAAVWRIESARLTAGLARLTGDVASAEDLAQDALVAALEQWPRHGIPPNPGGWLVVTAKRRHIDHVRRGATLQRKLPALWHEDELRERAEPEQIDDAIDDHIGDDMLRLIFTACHPALSVESRVALTLRCLAGLSTEEIARAFLIPEATAAQRVVRAKKTLRDRQIGFELPTAEQTRDRLASVLQILYLIFNEGYAASSGADWVRAGLCEESQRLARVLAALMPDVAEVHGFLALVELQAARIPARTTNDGDAILIVDQDRSRWDRLLIRRGLTALDQAERSAADGSSIGPYVLQAGIAACHARAIRAQDTPWPTILGLYNVLRELWPNPVVELNRAVAVGMVHGARAGLTVTDTVAADPALRGYPYLPAVRAHLLQRAGEQPQARQEWLRAAEMTDNERQRQLYLRRAHAASETDQPDVDGASS